MMHGWCSERSVLMAWLLSIQQAICGDSSRAALEQDGVVAAGVSSSAACMSTLDTVSLAGLGGPKPDAVWPSLDRENPGKETCCFQHAEKSEMQASQVPCLVADCLHIKSNSSRNMQNMLHSCRRPLCNTVWSATLYISGVLLKHCLTDVRWNGVSALPSQHSRRAARLTLCRGLPCDECCLRGPSARCTTRARLPNDESSQPGRLDIEDGPLTLRLKALQGV